MRNQEYPQSDTRVSVRSPFPLSWPDTHQTRHLVRPPPRRAYARECPPRQQPSTQRPEPPRELQILRAGLEHPGPHDTEVLSHHRVRQGILRRAIFALMLQREKEETAPPWVPISAAQNSALAPVETQSKACSSTSWIYAFIVATQSASR
ncbi:hypothetical protein BDW62DRAFT_168749 [Aspergillus aurantiobrunneus]